MAETGPGWTLSAALSPAQETAPADPTDESLDTRRDWAKASAEVRATVKWLITALAAVGAMLFAKGLISTPQLSWSENRAQLTWALIAGVLGLLGIGALIAFAVRLLRPAMFGLRDLPPSFVSLVEASPTEYLPTGVTSLEDFERRYRRAQRGVFSSSQILRELTITASRPDPQGTQGAAAKAAKDLEKAKAGRDVFVHNWAVYRQAKESLLERAEYHTQIAGLSRSRLLALIGSGVLAAAGGIGYVLALSAPADTKEASAPAAKPVVGELIRMPTPVAEQLWRDLGLVECQADAGVARVAVIIASGTGAATDPFTVTTLPTGTCRAVTFPVIADLATVIRPEPLAITYTPAPAPKVRLTPSPGQAPTLRPSASPG